MSELEKPETILRRIADLVERKRTANIELLFQAKIDELIEPSIRALLPIERQLAMIEVKCDSIIDTFLSRCVIKAPPIESTPQYKGPGRPSTISSTEPIVSCVELHSHFVEYANSNKAVPMSFVPFCQSMAKRGHHSKRVRGVGSYVGIRLRTDLDPLPRFFREIFPTPPRIEAMGHTLMQATWHKGELRVEESVRQWVRARYELCDVEDVTDAMVMRKAFLDDPKNAHLADDLSEDSFCISTGAIIYDSYPSEYRWLLPPDRPTELWVETDGCSPTKHLFVQSRRRWLMLKKREVVVPDPCVENTNDVVHKGST